LRQFKDALRQRVNGRTPLLDEVLSGVEAKAKNLEADLNVMNKYAESQSVSPRIGLKTTAYRLLTSFPTVLYEMK